MSCLADQRAVFLPAQPLKSLRPARLGVNEEQTLEAIRVTSEIRVVAVHAHSTLAIDAINQARVEKKAA